MALTFLLERRQVLLVRAASAPRIPPLQAYLSGKLALHAHPDDGRTV